MIKVLHTVEGSGHLPHPAINAPPPTGRPRASPLRCRPPPRGLVRLLPRQRGAAGRVPWESDAPSARASGARSPPRSRSSRSARAPRGGTCTRGTAYAARTGEPRVRGGLEAFIREDSGTRETWAGSGPRGHPTHPPELPDFVFRSLRRGAASNDRGGAAHGGLIAQCTTPPWRDATALARAARPVRAHPADEAAHVRFHCEGWRCSAPAAHGLRCAGAGRAAGVFRRRAGGVVGHRAALVRGDSPSACTGACWERFATRVGDDTPTATALAHGPLSVGSSTSAA